MFRDVRHMLLLAALATIGLAPATSADDNATNADQLPVLRAGERFVLVGHTATLAKLEDFPLVDDAYTRRFTFDSFDNAKLKELRESYRLDQVVAPGNDEFHRQVLLMDWVHRRFKKFGRPSCDARGALEILAAIDKGETFFCAQYAEVLVSCAASLGWIDRPLALRRHQGVAKVGGSTEHSVTEIWSNQHRKWVMLDPTLNLYIQRNGVPLNAYEIRQEWFNHDGANLALMVGKEHKRYAKADLPIVLGHFADFGDLSLQPDELDKYGFIGYVPNTNLMDAGYDYGGMFIVKDHLCDGTRWHTRDVPTNPAVDPYFPLNQASLSLTVAGDALDVNLKTQTPNFQRFEIQHESGLWRTTGDHFVWRVHTGQNRLAVRTVNKFNVVGPVSVAEVVIAP